MLRYSQDVFLEITNYLSWQHIPFDAKSKVGIITFSAETPGSDILYKHYVNLSEDAVHLEVSSPLEVPQTEKIQLRLLKFCNEVNRTGRNCPLRCTRISPTKMTGAAFPVPRWRRTVGCICFTLPFPMTGSRPSPWRTLMTEFIL